MEFRLRHSEKFGKGFKEKFDQLEDKGDLIGSKKLIMEFVEEDIVMKNTMGHILFVVYMISFIPLLYTLKMLLPVPSIILLVVNTVLYLFHKKQKEYITIATMMKEWTLSIYDNEIKEKYNTH